MLLIKVHLGEPEYVLVQHGQPIAHWFASTVWGSVVKKLLERLDFRVEEIDATNMAESFMQFGDEDSLDCDVFTLIQAVLEEFGVEALSQPLDHEQAMHLREKVMILNGTLLPEGVLLS
jgi:hypothetical protein